MFSTTREIPSGSHPCVFRELFRQSGGLIMKIDDPRSSSSPERLSVRLHAGVFLNLVTEGSHVL